MISHYSYAPKQPRVWWQLVGGRRPRGRHSTIGILSWRRIAPTAASYGSTVMLDVKPDLAGLEPLELELVQLGQPRFHARQLFQWIHKRAVGDFSQMSDLPRELREPQCAR